MPETTKETGVSLAMVKELLAEQARQNQQNMLELAQELRKPTVLEQKVLDEAAKKVLEKNEERKANAQGQKMKMENSRLAKKYCNHKHRLTGQTHCVEVIVQNQPTYILCQKNQCKIFPGNPPDGYTGTDIYDTKLFMEISQTLGNLGSEILD